MSLFRYTRNGELLGDGFVPVYESNLVPVVGFHSNGESVRVNFGLVPFAYEVSSREYDTIRYEGSWYDACILTVTVTVRPEESVCRS